MVSNFVFASAPTLAALSAAERAVDAASFACCADWVAAWAF
jgi:hypothetical protein